MNLSTNQALMTAGFIALAATSAPTHAAEFTLLNDPNLDGTGFEQRWNNTNVWQYVSGVDDGTAGIPDGLDTFTIDRNVGGFPAGNTVLSNEGMPNHTIAGITATGAPGRDVILKFTGELTVGDLAVLASPSTFEIALERDQDFDINGVISGAGNLLIARNASFSDVEPDELITIGGSALNTITGAITLRNNNNDNPVEDAFFVADKVGAFGQSSALTVSAANNTTLTSLRLTTNTIGGEGAIDDDATSVFLNDNSVFSVDAGVDEFIGSGNLTVNGQAIGDGIYDNNESWITGDGTVTVGVPEPSSLALLGLGGLLIARRRRG
jgi:hypothetical protein